MRGALSALSLGLVLMFVAACQQPQAEPEYRPTATVKDIMDSMVDPVADVIWNSVSTVVTSTGTEDRSPKSDEEWAVVRRAGITLMEAANVLQTPGRKVADFGHKSQYPGIELEPEEIQALVDADRRTWIQLALGLHDAAADALKTIEAKDAEGLLNEGEKIQHACETCHLKYWYPNQVIPPFPGTTAKP